MDHIIYLGCKCYIRESSVLYYIPDITYNNEKYTYKILLMLNTKDNIYIRNDNLYDTYDDAYNAYITQANNIFTLLNNRVIDLGFGGYFKISEIIRIDMYPYLSTNSKYKYSIMFYINNLAAPAYLPINAEFDSELLAYNDYIAKVNDIINRINV